MEVRHSDFDVFNALELDDDDVNKQKPESVKTSSSSHQNFSEVDLLGYKIVGRLAIFSLWMAMDAFKYYIKVVFIFSNLITSSLFYSLKLFYKHFIIFLMEIK